MTCYYPQKAYESITKLTENGKKLIVFSKGNKGPYKEIELPCTQCIGCRIDKSRQWAARCVHEASMFTDNSFITLTYNDECLPEKNQLDKTHLQKFFKRLRKRHQGTTAVQKYDEVGNEAGIHFPIRYFAVGEYGDLTQRPHYHAILFNFDFTDKIFFKKSKNNKLFISQDLQRLWSKKISETEVEYYPKEHLYKEGKNIYCKLGHVTVGAVTYESAAYCASYCMKKINGKMKEKHYRRFGEIDYDTGEIETYCIEQEFSTMSRRPGIGREWWKKFGGTDLTQDCVDIEGRKIKPPKYYDLLLEKYDNDKFYDLKEGRKEIAKKYESERTEKRLKARRRVAEQKLKIKERKSC